MNSKYLKDFLILAGVIIIAAIGARILAGGETLDEYAKKNPQKAEVSKQLPEADNDAQKDAGQDPAPPGEEASPDNDSGESKSPDTDVTTNTTAVLSNDTIDVKDGESDTDSATGTNLDAETAKDEASGSISLERVSYMDGFYYEPISNEVFKRISGISYPVDCTVPLDELRYVVLEYIDFEGQKKKGEMICNKLIANDVLEIFYELCQSDYRIESIRLVDEFGGNDIASMQANNTSCFNYRVIEGTTKLSNHSFGLAIDINPLYNPYITYGKDGTMHISPAESAEYADRSVNFPYKIDENDLAYKLFTKHGFKWGGNWNSSKDYQHFERK